MAKQTYTTGQVLTAAQMTTLQTNDFNQTVSAKTASYTLVASDAGTRITMSNASANTITVNTGLFTAGDTLQITNIGAGVLTITAGTATVATAGVLTLAQNASGTLYFTSTGVSIFNGSSASAASTNTYTLLNAGGTLLTAATTITVSFSAVNNLQIWIDDASSANASSTISIRLNSDTGTNYYYAGLINDGGGLISVGSYTTSFTNINQGTSAGDTLRGFMHIEGAKTTTIKPVRYSVFASSPSSGSSNAPTVNGMYVGTSAVTSVSIISSTGNFDAGKIYIYGAD